MHLANNFLSISVLRKFMQFLLVLLKTQVLFFWNVKFQTISNELRVSRLRQPIRWYRHIFLNKLNPFLILATVIGIMLHSTNFPSEEFEASQKLDGWNWQKQPHNIQQKFKKLGQKDTGRTRKGLSQPNLRFSWLLAVVRTQLLNVLSPHAIETSRSVLLCKHRKSVLKYRCYTFICSNFLMGELFCVTFCLIKCNRVSEW